MPAAPSESAIGPPRPPAPTMVARIGGITPPPFRRSCRRRSCRGLSADLALPVVCDHADAGAVDTEPAIAALVLVVVRFAVAVLDLVLVVVAVVIVDAFVL